MFIWLCYVTFFYSPISSVFLLFVITVYYIGRSNSVETLHYCIIYISTVNKDYLALCESEVQMLVMHAPGCYYTDHVGV